MIRLFDRKRAQKLFVFHFKILSILVTSVFLSSEMVKTYNSSLWIFWFVWQILLPLFICYMLFVIYVSIFLLPKILDSKSRGIILIQVRLCVKIYLKTNKHKKWKFDRRYFIFLGEIHWKFIFLTSMEYKDIIKLEASKPKCANPNYI